MPVGEEAVVQVVVVQLVVVAAVEAAAAAPAAAKAAVVAAPSVVGATLRSSFSRPATTTLRLGGYPFVGNSEMAPFFWLAPGGANFLLCLLLRRHCCSAYLLSKTQEVLFWPCLSVRSTPFTCLERAQRREIALVA